MLLYLSFKRRIVLLLLLMSAAPMRAAPFPVEKETAAERERQREREGMQEWHWAMERPKSSYQYRDFLDNGNPLPKTEAEEMANGFGNALAPPFNFPRKHWSHWQQQSNKQLQQLQLQQLTWQGDLQSPAVVSVPKTKLKKYHNENVAQEFHEWKRATNEYKGTRYRPSISAGVMTNLGDFFKQLKANVHFAEHSQQLGAGESQLLEGLHPFTPTEDADTTAADTDYDSGQPPDRNPSKMLQSVRSSYRPSQKIRSLVSRNPNGYRGSQFIDPSYMWLGLGK